MSGIVGGINLRSSGLINNSSAADGQVFTGTGAGLPAGFEAAAGGGKMLQIVNTTLTSIVTQSVSANAAHGTDIPGLTLAITAASTSNRIFVSGHINVGRDSNDVNSSVSIRVFLSDGGGTAANLDAVSGDAAGSRARGISGGTNHNNDYTRTAIPFQFFHTPPSTDELIYSIRFVNHDGDTANLHVNRNEGNNDSEANIRASSSITAIECDVS